MATGLRIERDEGQLLGQKHIATVPVASPAKALTRRLGAVLGAGPRGAMS